VKRRPGRKTRLAERNLCRICESPLSSQNAPTHKPHFLGLCDACRKFDYCAGTPLVSRGALQQLTPLPEVRQLSASQLSRAERTILEQLAYLATLAEKGDSAAFETLIRIAEGAVIGLRLAPRALALKYSRRKAGWPIFATHKGSHNAEIKELQLGRDLPKGKKTESGAQATTLLCWLIQNQFALELPKLNRRTRANWFEVGWNAILFETRGQPEDDSVLRDFGASAAHKPKYSKNVQNSGRSQIRARIKETLKLPFKKACEFIIQNPLQDSVENAKA
jgi:hypothetical protein